MDPSWGSLGFRVSGLGYNNPKIRQKAFIIPLDRLTIRRCESVEFRSHMGCRQRAQRTVQHRQKSVV